MNKPLTAIITVALAAGGTACSASDDSDTAATSRTPPINTAPATTSTTDATPTTMGPPGTPTTAVLATTAASSILTTGAGDDQQTVVRFSAGETFIDVAVTGDNATTRDLVSMLPVTLRFEEFNGREKVSYLPRPLETDGVGGSDPNDGDLIYYTPWGNLGFYYNTAGIEFSDDVIHLGTYNATPEQLANLEGRDVTVAVL